MLIGIKKESLDIVNRTLRKHKSIKDPTLKYFLDWVAIDENGFLNFRYDEDGFDDYEPDEEGLVPAKEGGKWYGEESIVEWLKPYCTARSKLIFHCQEGDGEAFGYEFDGKGRVRGLSLIPVTKWH